MESIGFVFGFVMVLFVGSVEFFGGIVLIFGLFICFVVVFSVFIMVVVIFSVYGSNGLFMSNNGYEFVLVLLVVIIVLVI